MRALIAILITTVFLYAGSDGLAQPPASERLPLGSAAGFEVVPPPTTAAPARYVGSSSCMAANCHGGADRPRPSAGDAWSSVASHLWIQNDPHAQSYATLLSNASRSMISKLGGGAPAHRRSDCLACHAPEGGAIEFTTAHRSTVADGVGCEACHGPAENWLAAHPSPQWLGLSGAVKQSRGFVDLDNLAQRSRACAACHVGSPGLDVSHDLIAAGHPRLLFEMSSLHARLPKHWRDEREGKATLDAKLWSVGRVVGASEAARLLAERARNPHGAWPEFAAHDCYSCHHTLSDSRWRQEAGRPRGEGAGGLALERWNYALLSAAGLGGEGFDEGDLLADLRREMSQPLPDRRLVAAAADGVGDLLAWEADTLAALPFDHGRVRSGLAELSGVEEGDLRWAVAAQRFLGLSALHYSDVASTPRQLRWAPRTRRGPLVLLRETLRFDDGSAEDAYNSPRQWSAGLSDSAHRQVMAIHNTP